MPTRSGKEYLKPFLPSISLPLNTLLSHITCCGERQVLYHCITCKKLRTSIEVVIINSTSIDIVCGYCGSHVENCTDTYYQTITKIRNHQDDNKWKTYHQDPPTITYGNTDTEREHLASLAERIHLNSWITNMSTENPYYSCGTFIPPMSDYEHMKIRRNMHPPTITYGGGGSSWDHGRGGSSWNPSWGSPCG